LAALSLMYNIKVNIYGRGVMIVDLNNRNCDVFFAEMDPQTAKFIVNKALDNVEYGELYLEYKKNQEFYIENGKLVKSNFDISTGFGLRAVNKESVSYACSTDLSEKSLKEAAGFISSSIKHKGGRLETLNKRTFFSRPADLIDNIDLEKKINFLKEIHDYAINIDKHVKTCSISFKYSWQVVTILGRNGAYITDTRPLISLNITVYAKKCSRQGVGSCGIGGRYFCNSFLKLKSWIPAVQDAVRQSLVNLESMSAPAGESTIVLGNGWPGIFLHEAIGHGLEADCNRKKTSVFTNLIGKKIASEGVTIIDDGTLPEQRGSLGIDDEGTLAKRTILIEDGILSSYIQDHFNSHLMKTKSTGNGRRESFLFPPLPRMTNTFMQPGNCNPEDIIQSVKKGIYAVNFAGGRVDITSGQFVFFTTEAYLIEDGKITRPLKKVMFCGDSLTTLKKIKMIGNNLKLDNNTGNCGKNGQTVPVGVGMPTIKIESMTVGGTQL